MAVCVSVCGIVVAMVGRDDDTVHCAHLWRGGRALVAAMSALARMGCVYVVSIVHFYFLLV